MECSRLSLDPLESSCEDDVFSFFREAPPSLSAPPPPASPLPPLALSSGETSRPDLQVREQRPSVTMRFTDAPVVVITCYYCCYYLLKLLFLVVLLLVLLLLLLLTQVLTNLMKMVNVIIRSI